MEKSKKARVVHQDELLLMLGEKQHEVQMAYCCPVHVDNLDEARIIHSSAHDVLGLSNKYSWLQQLFAELTTDFPGRNIQNLGEQLQVESFHVSTCWKDDCPYRIIDSPRRKLAAVYFCCTWSVADGKLAWEIISTMEKCHLTMQDLNQNTDLKDTNSSKRR